MSIQEEILSFNRNSYQKDNFDAFLKKVSFSYNISSIHVAGTNGKGSVCNYLANVYIAQGYKVGLFTSPYFKRINEMIRINQKEISDEEIEKIFDAHSKLFKKYDLSSFEIETFVALTYFQKEQVDIAIIECGMGGELDATNIFNPILSIITSVSIEHTNFLGVSLSEIALHKAGIIKKDVPCLLGNFDGDALDVIVDICRKNNSKITKISQFHRENCAETGYTFDYGIYENISISSRAKSSVIDACLALDALTILSEKFPVDKDNVSKGMKGLLPSGRFSFFKLDNTTIIVDGAHNPEAVCKLREDIDGLRLDKPIRVVFASFKDKNITMMLPEISLLGEVYLTSFDHPRARGEMEYFLYLEEYKYFENHISLIKEIKEKYPNDYILVTGSLAFAYLVCDEIKSHVI